ncbi:hypothetical protein HMPREF9336_02362 [Segniliparus rugosus ATCC BAA-974]|uniref:Major facilitator superfamily (MFS) profile domain-containing protein n=1 Tax=Segniliparus rugosus (strain ATCC BAA-974 / DSM 45345 / CCUG 50838 / CIP 108380 / JCM 13579 / CDC 945) TaxID=679197 RepID=E5XS90_SEGRC|nr:hypothetical protein HMPREF9336_02362 [Segniliparus rugosus ATCC BAA-974]
MARTDNGTKETAPDGQARKAVWGALVGTALEWYNFFLSGTAAALAVGFVARPLGGVVFGRMGAITWLGADKLAKPAARRSPRPDRSPRTRLVGCSAPPFGP